MIGTRHINEAIKQCSDLPFEFQLHRVPFFLEDRYLKESDDFRESHQDRMVRKFGSAEAFNAFKARHGLVSRANEVGLSWDEETLSNRIQSSTLKSHRLVQWISRQYSLEHAEKFFTVLNRRHFCEGGALNDLSVLLSSAEEAGIDTTEANIFLASKKGIYIYFF